MFLKKSTMAQLKSIDAYIEKAQPFAQPILRHFRSLVHEVCPDVEEKLKWGMPHFDYKGEMMCSMASFKAHAVIGFWKASLMKDPKLMENAASETAMGHMGKLTSLKDLPSDKKLKSYIQEAMQLNEDGVRVQRVKPKTTPSVKTPTILLDALKKNKKAFKVWESASPSFKKEYAVWITDAKAEATRLRRLTDAVLWISEGKGKNWKYERK